MDDLSTFCCQNDQCSDYGKRGIGNLTVCDRYGRDRQYRMLYCRTCKARFSARKGTALYNTRLPEAKAVAVLAHLADGCGIRQTARLTGVHRDTVMRLAREAGAHAVAAHAELVAVSPPDAGDSIRREVGLRREEAGALRS